MAEKVEKSPAKIFSEIGAALDKQAVFDSGLAKIICEKILVVNGDEHAVGNALEAIQKLARQRAGIKE